MPTAHPMLCSTRVHFGVPSGGPFRPSHEWLEDLRDEASGTRCKVEAFAGKTGTGKLIAWEGRLYAEMLSPNPHEEALCVNCGSQKHDMDDCPHPEDPRVRECIFCERVGHYGKDCPLPIAPSGRFLDFDVIPILTIAALESHERLYACFPEEDSGTLTSVELWLRLAKLNSLESRWLAGV